MLTELSFCQFIEYYKHNISGYADVSICFIGVILNLFNILVFTRKHMISSANLIFTHLATVDLLILSVGIPYSWIWFFQYENSDYERSTHTRAVIYASCMCLAFTLSHMSVFLTVMLATWRYIAVAYPLKERDWCNTNSTNNIVLAGYIFSFLISTPIYFSYDIMLKASSDKVPYYEPNYNENSILQYISFIIKGVLQQLLPSIILPILSLKLIAALLRRKESNEEQFTSSSNSRNDSRNFRMKQQTDRSIIITLIVVALFLVFQIPKGVFNLLESIPVIYGKPKSHPLGCFFNFVEILDTLFFFNMSITFVVYYAMSDNFRTTFESLFINSRNNKGNISSLKTDQTTTDSRRKSDTPPEVSQV